MCFLCAQVARFRVVSLGSPPDSSVRFEHFRFSATHHTGDGEGTGCVTHQDGEGVERAVHTIQCSQAFIRAGQCG